jgi:FMN phosphatase YigB (HAD superfamily)
MRAREIQPKKLVIFDIDDTLVYTQTKVHVVKDGKVVNSLNSHDFTHYELKPGEEFDFEDFRNAQEFFNNSRPNIPMITQLKRDIDTGNKVVMVTARADFDDRELFLDTFRKFGIDIDRVHVYRAGNSKTGTTEERKKQIIKRLLDQDEYSMAIMYDDAKPNLHTFVELKKDHPSTKFYAWHVSLDGHATEYLREQYATTEASYPGNIGIMELTKFFKIANTKEKEVLDKLINKKKFSLAWQLIQKVTGTRLQGKEFA